MDTLQSPISIIVIDNHDSLSIFRRCRFMHRLSDSQQPAGTVPGASARLREAGSQNESHRTKIALETSEMAEGQKGPKIAAFAGSNSDRVELSLIHLSFNSISRPTGQTGEQRQHPWIGSWRTTTTLRRLGPGIRPATRSCRPTPPFMMSLRFRFGQNAESASGSPSTTSRSA